jgi:hypothetical protein
MTSAATLLNDPPEILRLMVVPAAASAVLLLLLGVLLHGRARHAAMVLASGAGLLSVTAYALYLPVSA